MVHPSRQARMFVFDQFCQKHLSASALESSSSIHKVLTNIEHKPLFPKSVSYRKHLETTLAAMHKIGIIMIARYIQ